MWSTIPLYIIELVAFCFVFIFFVSFSVFLILFVFCCFFILSTTQLSILCLCQKNFFRKKDVSSETDLKDAASVCLPLIYATMKDIEKGTFPKGCLLNVNIPSCPLRNKV